MITRDFADILFQCNQDNHALTCLPAGTVSGSDNQR